VALPLDATNGHFGQWPSQQQRRSGSEPAARLAPVIFLQEPILADVTGCPNATQPGTFHRQHLLSKALEGELASHLWDLPRLWPKGGELPRFSHQPVANP
jgi:hypothetical protein